MPTTSTKPQPKDPKARALLDEKVAAYQAITGDDENEHWRVGKIVSEILELNLPERCGYRNTYAFMANELKAGRSTLSQYVAVARAFPETSAARYGMSRLQRLLTLRNLLGGPELPGDPGDVEVAVPAREKAAPPETKRFKDCSVADLNKAIAAQKPAAAHPPSGDKPGSDAPPSAEIIALTRSFQAELDSVCGEESPAAAKARRQDAQVEIDLLRIPLDKIPEVCAALAKIVRVEGPE
ncbi:MAG: hypothetical protein HY901_14040 [Deltaproteobacteria bacterium]|nr:hypothetical protein [Deltaproteobacteria bacterium]